MTTAGEAYAHAEKAHDKMKAHEDLCALRYEGITTSLTSLHSTVRGARNTGVAIGVALIGWLFVQVYEKVLETPAPPPPQSVSLVR